MAATDHLGPQFGEEGKFDPSGDIYGSPDSEFRYSRITPEGETIRTSREAANRQGRNRAADIDLKIPTGASTDFRADGLQHPSRQDERPDYRSRFVPVDPGRFPEGKLN